jgi:hypothetical protein
MNSCIFDPHQNVLQHMKNTRAFFCVFCLFLFMIQSCTIEKRRYMGGYHIDRFKTAKTNTPNEKPEVAEKAQLETGQTPANVDPSLATTPEIDTTQQQSTPEPKPLAKDDSKSSSRGAKTTKFLDRVDAGVQKAFGYETQVSRPTENDETAKTSVLAIVSIAIAVLAALLFVLAIFVFEGWAALGYVVLAIMVTILSWLIGILAIVLDRKKGRRLPILFYILFGLTSILSLWFIIGFTLSKLGVI